jgi:hypothetical protein
MNQLPAFRLKHLAAAALLLLMVPSIHCTKSGASSSSSGKGANGALLSKEVLVAADAAGVTVDSMVTNYQYDGNNNVNGLQQSSVVTAASAQITTSINYSMAYSGNVISGLTGTINENVVDGIVNLSATTKVNTSFQSSGGHVTSYVQKATTTGSTLIPPTPETANDSVLLTYDASGNISTLTVYQINPSTKSYELNSTETFTFSTGNLAETVVVTYAGGAATDTFTTDYQYDGKNSAAPAYIFPGIAIVNVNNLTKTSETETGVNPGSVVTTYTTTYTSANQPATSQATVATTPLSSGIIATENITYTYQ